MAQAVLMEGNGKVLCKKPEVVVGGINRKSRSDGHGTNQEIDAGPLDAPGAASVKVLGSGDIIFGQDGKIGKAIKMHSKRFKLGSAADARQQFLPNRSDHLDAMTNNKAPQRFQDACLIGPGPPA